MASIIVVICTNINTIHFCWSGVVLHLLTELSSSMQLATSTILFKQHPEIPMKVDNHPQVSNVWSPPRIWVPCGWRSALVLLSWKRLLINNSWLDHRQNKIAKLESTTRTTEHKEKVEKNLNGCIHTTMNQSTCVWVLILTWTDWVPREFVLV